MRLSSDLVFFPSVVSKIGSGYVDVSAQEIENTLKEFTQTDESIFNDEFAKVYSKMLEIGVSDEHLVDFIESENTKCNKNNNQNTSVDQSQTQSVDQIQSQTQSVDQSTSTDRSQINDNQISGNIKPLFQRTSIYITILSFLLSYL